MLKRTLCVLVVVAAVLAPATTAATRKTVANCATDVGAPHWRDSVVRDGERTYTSKEYHREFDMSLQNTCMKCHLDRETFCNRCHTYVGVAPKCWECHVEPGGASHGQD